MYGNDYGNEVEKWKVELIVERARKLGFRRDELEDVQQELILDVIAFEYDESRSNGATERTALTSLIDHRLKTLRRSQRRYQDHIEQVEPLPEADERQDIEHQQRRIDVEDAVAGLPEEDQELCRDLAEGRSITEIANKSGCGWHTVKRRVNQIRDHFEMHELDEWISERPLSMAWITDELIERTKKEMAPLYDEELTTDDAVEILMNLKRFAEALLKATEGRVSA